jgi:IS66 Orf2 like protein
VFRFDEGLKVYLHRQPVDFRMGIGSLSILVEQGMRRNPMDRQRMNRPPFTSQHAPFAK